MKRTVLLAIVALFSFSFVVSAQDQPTNDNEFSKWQARVRVLAVAPSVGDDLAIGTVDVSTAFIPELDFTYFFTKNIAAELILGTSKHDVEVDLQGIGNVDLGHVWLLPPTLNLQYHFYAGNLKPYVGAGVNYTIFYGIDEGAVVDMDYDNAVGFSLQAGIDYMLNDKWFLNVDFKKLWLKSDVTVNAGDLGVIPTEVELNPNLIGIGFGMKF
ncbi:MAG: outer membrane beta-barrel protein [Flavobacteriaceae bacterium]|nr:outer membrane beta-barrel protein [Flavobacteriaceae bacterium]